MIHNSTPNFAITQTDEIRRQPPELITTTETRPTSMFYVEFVRFIAPTDRITYAYAHLTHMCRILVSVCIYVMGTPSQIAQPARARNYAHWARPTLFGRPGKGLFCRLGAANRPLGPY